MLSKVCRAVFCGGIAILVWLGVRPYHDGLLRIGLPVALISMWLAVLALLWRWPWGRGVVAALPLLAAAPFFLPGKPYEKVGLRNDYIAAMKAMEGSPYVWGGECPQGIDCSGLPRRGLRVALLEQGWRHGNGAAFREWARQWWFDESAQAMAEGYRGMTRPTGVAGILRNLDLRDLQPGDLAVNSVGSHVIIYYGDGRWIQADPGPAKVFLADPKDFPNSWFDSRVTMHRWTLLDERTVNAP